MSYEHEVSLYPLLLLFFCFVRNAAAVNKVLLLAGNLISFPRGAMRTTGSQPNATLCCKQIVCKFICIAYSWMRFAVYFISLVSFWFTYHLP